MTLGGVLLVYIIFYIGTLIHSNIKNYETIGLADKSERTITVNGTGKVTGNNDIAVTSLGYGNTDKDVATAQKNNKSVMDPILKEVRALGIDDKDLKTGYSIRPEYTAVPDKAPELRGYHVDSSLQVKIRDLNMIPAVLSLAGKYGANQVGELQFTIDDTDNLKTVARDKALQDAQMKAVKLAETLGVRLKSVVTYSEYEGSDYPIFYGAAVSKAVDTPLSPEASASSGAPAGSKDVVMNVSVTYEIMSPTSRWSRW